MHQKLKQFFKGKETGAKITAYAFLVGMPTGILAFIGCEWIDWLVYGCVIFGILGVVLHLIQNWRVIFGIES